MSRVTVRPELVWLCLVVMKATMIAVVLVLFWVPPAGAQFSVLVVDTAYVNRPFIIGFAPSTTCYAQRRFISCWADEGMQAGVPRLYQLIHIERDGIPYIYQSIKSTRSGYVDTGKTYSARSTKKGLKIEVDENGGHPHRRAVVEYRLVAAPGPYPAAAESDK